MASTVTGLVPRHARTRIPKPTHDRSYFLPGVGTGCSGTGEFRGVEKEGRRNGASTSHRQARKREPAGPGGISRAEHRCSPPRSKTSVLYSSVGLGKATALLAQKGLLPTEMLGCPLEFAVWESDVKRMILEAPDAHELISSD